ncbi:MAG: UDP-D-galactose:(glucosyl)lipopolysaccharide-1,6-D-galactosyltransferase [archaeon ADurb.Bin336]|nr:MAG: UDP-D-galactose:(glucosyl)lipopolysaccharide-1,6-D-galactosyltransferase [archaeon ADurb.Bin336]
MKVLNIIDSLGLGGAQTVVKGIFEGQQRNKNIFLYALRKNEIITEINHENVFGYKSASKYSVFPLFELKKIIEKEKIDFIHCHLFRSQVFGWLLKKLFFPNIKLIFHEHGKIFKNQFFYNNFIRISKNKTNLFIAVSNSTKKELIENGKITEDNVKVLYNFVDLDKFNRKNITWNIHEEKTNLGLKNTDFVVGFAARLVERKGWEDFILASNKLIKKNKNFKFVIVGDGKDKEKMLSKINEFNLSNNIIYLGYSSKMVWFYSLLDCFVIPSQWEPMGLTEIEAQAMNIPVIATNVPALNEIIQDSENGLLFKAKDAMDLSRKIELIYKNKKLREKIIKNGLNNVKKYDLTNYKIELNKLYKDLK